MEDFRDTQFGKLLYKGAWSSGSITVGGLSDYTTFAARPDDTDFFLFGFSLPESGNWRLGGIYGNATPNAFAYYINASRSGNTLTMNYAGYVNVVVNNASVYDFTVFEIYGVS